MELSSVVDQLLKLASSHTSALKWTDGNLSSGGDLSEELLELAASHTLEDESLPYFSCGSKKEGANWPETLNKM